MDQVIDTVADITPQRSAKRQFAEMVAGPLVLNAWLKAICLGLLALVLVLAWTTVSATHAATNIKPLVVRIDAVGRAEAVAYDAATWKPQTPELRYFLTKFVTLHYARMRATIARDFPNSLFFLNGTLGNALLGHGGANGPVETFVQDRSADETDIDVTNVTFVNLTAPPYQASVDYKTVAYSPNSRTPKQTDTFTAQVAFTLLERVPNSYVKVNPLGLQITQLRVDQAFD